MQKIKHADREKLMVIDRLREMERSIVAGSARARFATISDTLFSPN